jgi:hypothetical protein
MRLFEFIEDWNPILASRFHAHIKAVVIGKPFTQLIQITVHGGEGLGDVIGDKAFCGSDCCDDLTLMNINATTNRTGNLQKITSFPEVKGTAAVTIILINNLSLLIKDKSTGSMAHLAVLEGQRHI